MKTYNNFIKENIMNNPSDGIGNVISKYLHMNELTIHFNLLLIPHVNIIDEIFYFYKDEAIYYWCKLSHNIWVCEDTISSISDEINESYNNTEEFISDFFKEYYKDCEQILTYSQEYKKEIITLFI